MDDGHSGCLQRLHLGAEYIRIHAHFRSGKGAAEIMVTQNGRAGFMLRNRNGEKAGGNGKGFRRLYRGVQVRFPGNGFRVRDGLRQERKNLSLREWVPPWGCIHPCGWLQSGL